MKEKKGSLRRFGMSFVYAFRGIGRSFRAEPNLKIHGAASALVVVCGAGLHISRTEWFVCLILIALVISLELMNTALENAVDLVSPEQSRLAEAAKDAAAGAVLVSASVAAVIGCVIFAPKILALI